MFRHLICFGLYSAVLGYTELAAQDKIENLPGAEGLDFNFNQFSGYLKIPESKHMHYWYFVLYHYDIK